MNVNTKCPLRCFAPPPPRNACAGEENRDGRRGIIYLTQHEADGHKTQRQADDLRDSWEFFVLKSAVGESSALALLENQFDYGNPSLVNIEANRL